MKKILAISVLALLMAGCAIGTGGKTLSQDEIKTTMQQFLKEQGKETAVIQKIEEENGVYKVTADFGGGQVASAYVTKDGKTLFPQAVDIQDTLKKQEEAKQTQEKNKTEQLAKLDKQEKPSVDLFIMSYCPFGLQALKGMIPVAEALGDKVDFKVRFVDYSMHEKKEIDENLQEYCIQKEEPSKLLPYLKCFVAGGKSEECLKSSEIDAEKIGSCVNKTDGEFKITESYNNKESWGSQFPPFAVDKEDATKYKVQGSPSLVVNGTLLDGAGRSPKALMEAVCAGFTTAPEECGKEMSADTPAAGFDTGTAQGGADASCGQ